MILWLGAICAPPTLAANVYWTDSITDQVLRGAKNGSGTVSELFGLADYPGAPSSVNPGFIAIDSAVPEPRTVSLATAGLLGLGVCVWRRNRMARARRIAVRRRGQTQ